MLQSMGSQTVGQDLATEGQCGGSGKKGKEACAPAQEERPLRDAPELQECRAERSSGG